MTGSNIFLTTNPGLETALKEEIKWRYPHWRVAFSASGFLTYKSDEAYSSLQVADLPLFFARRRGLITAKLNQAEVSQLALNGPTHYWGLKEFQQECKIVECQSADQMKVIDVIKLQEDSYFLGEHREEQWQGLAIGVNKFEAGPALKVPSRAYYKLSQAMNLLSGYKDQVKNVQALDLGCAPGGSSLFLLEKGFKVLGVDTAQMSKQCLDFGQGQQFIHWPYPIQKLDRDFCQSMGPFELVACDINLRPLDVMKFLLPLLKSNKGQLKELYWTVKVTDWPKRLDYFFKVVTVQIEESILKLRPKKVRWLFLPAHHREILLYVQL